MVNSVVQGWMMLVALIVADAALITDTPSVVCLPSPSGRGAGGEGQGLTTRPINVLFVRPTRRTASLTPTLFQGDREPEKARSALGKGDFPWYDSARDTIRPLKAPPNRSKIPTTRTTQGVGDLLSYAVFGLALVSLVGLLAWLWWRYEPSADSDAIAKIKKPGSAVAVDELPQGLRRGFDLSDAWAEANRRRASGDLAGAIVCLFAHQLVTLSKLGLVRLAPGKTGRQLLRAVTEPEFRTLVLPTLRLFEAAYYGHQAPSQSEFDHAWTSAEDFERRIASGVSP